MSNWLLAFSSAAEVIEGLVALSICHYAYRFYRLSGEEALASLSASFLALSVGLLVHGTSLALICLVTSGFARPALRTAILLASRIMGLVLFGCEALAYGYLAYSYAKPGRRAAALVLLPVLAAAQRPPEPEALIRFVRYHPVLECLVLGLLIYLAYRTISNFLSSRDANPFLVSFAFLFLTAAHACFMLSYFLAALYLTAHILQLLAFLCMLMMLLRVISA